MIPIEGHKRLATALSLLWPCVFLLLAGAATSQEEPEFALSDRYPLPMEATLVRKLQERYEATGKVARPKKNSKGAIKVRFGLRLIQMDIDEKAQSMKASVWAKMGWRDEHLTWNPSVYDGINRLTLPWSDVWLPDISLVNTAETEEKQRDADLMVSFTGQMYWVPHRTYTSACLLDITNYPYDQHTCSMWFQSMAHYTEALNLTTYEPKPWDITTYLDSFKESQEWEIIDYATERIERPRDVGMVIKFSNRPALRFTITVRRRLGYTGHLLMLPCVLLGCMTLIVFCLPPERPDRNTLAMSLFASFMVLLLILVEVVPPTAASVPKLGVYYAFNMTLVMVAVFLSGTTIHISRLGDNRKPVPRILKVIFIDFLARVLLMYDRVAGVFQFNPQRRRQREADKKEPTPDITQPSLYPTLLPADNHHGQQMDNDVAGNSAQGMTNNVQPSPLSNVVLQMDNRMDKVEKVVSRALEETSATANYEQEVRLLRVQWRNVSLVLDRLCIVTYTIAIVVSLIVLFPRPQWEK